MKLTSGGGWEILRLNTLSRDKYNTGDDGDDERFTISVADELEGNFSSMYLTQCQLKTLISNAQNMIDNIV